MKTKVWIKEVGKRTKAFKGDEFVKTVPKPFIKLVNSLGFIDVRQDKKTLSYEERLLLILYKKTESMRDIPNYSGLNDIQILNKNHVLTKTMDEYFTVSILNGPDVKIKKSEWDNLNCEEKEVKIWA